MAINPATHIIEYEEIPIQYVFAYAKNKEHAQQVANSLGNAEVIIIEEEAPDSDTEDSLFISNSKKEIV